MPENAYIELDALRALHQEGNFESVLERMEGLESLDSEHRVLAYLCRQMSGAGATIDPLVDSALAETPANSAWASDLALAQLLRGDIPRAEELLLGIIDQDRGDAVDYGRLAACYVSLGRTEEAIANYQEAVQREPGRKHWHHNLAHVMASQQQYDEALEQYDIVLQLDPEFDPSVKQRRLLLRQMDKIEEVIIDLEQRLTEDPDSMPLRLELARTLDADGRMTDGIRVLREPMLKLADLLASQAEAEAEPQAEAEEEAEPKVDAMAETDAGTETEASAEDTRKEQIKLRLALAAIWEHHSRYAMALVLLDEVEQLVPEGESKGVKHRQVVAHSEMGKHDEAQAILDDLLAEYPDDQPLKIQHATLLAERGRYDEAEELLRELLDVYPGHAGLLSSLGNTLLWTGKLDEAYECFLKASEINPMALIGLTKTRYMPQDPAALGQMEKIVDNRLLQGEVRANMAFALGEVYEQRQEHDRAFEFLVQANALVDKVVKYQPAHFTRRTNVMIKRYDQAYFDGLEPLRGSDRTPIFVVGMPRSGTTLTEQILASHPQVFGAGELDLIPVLARLLPRVINTGKRFPACIDSFSTHLREEGARYYLYGLSQHDSGHPFVVDKMPHNFMNLGLIASILPRAKIIHIRRDPRDTALSNYQQNFKAKDGGMGYSFDLEKIAAQINDYHRMMEHWQSVLPIPIFDLFYEDMVQDQEGMTRQLLSFIGVEWDDTVKDFHKHERAVRTASVAQVRQPMYQSSRQKWRKYEAELAPLLESLTPEALAPWSGDA